MERGQGVKVVTWQRVGEREEGAFNLESGIDLGKLMNNNHLFPPVEHRWLLYYLPIMAIATYRGTR